jgi:hypothetical protein
MKDLGSLAKLRFHCDRNPCLDKSLLNELNRGLTGCFPILMGYQARLSRKVLSTDITGCHILQTG